MAETTEIYVTTAADESGASAVSTVSLDALLIIYCFIGVIGFLGNSFVMGVLLSGATVRKKITNIYLINQAVIDALSCLLVMTFSLTATDGANMSGLADDLLCRLWLTRFPIWSMVMNSTYGLIALTLDRYFRIVHPVAYKNHFTKKKLVAILITVWLWGPVYNFSWNWPSSGVVDGTCLIFALYPSQLASSAVGVLTVFFQYFLPLFALSFCYIRMILVIKGRIKPTDAGASAVAGGAKKPQDNFEKAKSNIIKTLIFVGICFVLCWTWNEFFILLFFLGHPSDFGSPFYHFTVVAVFSNSCINPFIYCAKYDDFKQQLKKLVGKGASSGNQGNDGVTAMTTVGENTRNAKDSA